MKVCSGYVVSALSLAACAGLAQGQSFSEGFEGGALPAGWINTNNSTPPLGAQTWQVNNTGTIAGGAANLAPAHGGTFAAYVNFLSTAGSTGTETISNWLMTSQATGVNNNDTFSLWTRCRTGSVYPDRLQVRLSTAGASSNVGSLPTDVGDFTTLLLDINPAYSDLHTGCVPTGNTVNCYPEAYTQYTVTLAGLGGASSGRFAFRYFVENGGPAGANSEMIGIDDVAYVQAGAIGACCKPDGTCAEGQTLAQCNGLSGTFQAGVLCANANCPQPGACCNFDGTCTANVFEAQCLGGGGLKWLLGNNNCASANCSQPCPAITNSLTGFGTGTSSDPAAVFGTQTNRLFRDGVPDNCTLAASGGAPIAGTFTYVAHAFTNNSPNPQCVTFQADIDCTATGNPIYGAAYVGGPFDPANILVNNVASTGGSIVTGPIGMSFTVPGNASFQIVLSEVTPAAACATMSFRLNGGGNLSCNPPAPPACYANCDSSTQTPVLNVADFTCFLTKYASGNPNNVADPANCDGSTQIPVLNVADFTCFLTKYAGGCP